MVYLEGFIIYQFFKDFIYEKYSNFGIKSLD